MFAVHVYYDQHSTHNYTDHNLSKTVLKCVRKILLYYVVQTDYRTDQIVQTVKKTQLKTPLKIRLKIQLKNFEKHSQNTVSLLNT